MEHLLTRDSDASRLMMSIARRYAPMDAVNVVG
jgi:hypothetical protein